jgi:hypothetical protein
MTETAQRFTSSLGVTYLVADTRDSRFNLCGDASVKASRALAAIPPAFPFLRPIGVTLARPTPSRSAK